MLEQRLRGPGEGCRGRTSGRDREAPGWAHGEAISRPRREPSRPCERSTRRKNRAGARTRSNSTYPAHPSSGSGRVRSRARARARGATARGERSENEKNPKRKENWILKHLENLARGTLAQLHLAPAHVCTNAEIRSDVRATESSVRRRLVSQSHLTSRHSTTRHSPDSTGAHATRPIRTHDTNTHKTAHMTQTRTSCPRRFLQTPLLCTPQFRNSLRSSLLLT